MKGEVGVTRNIKKRNGWYQALVLGKSGNPSIHALFFICSHTSQGPCDEGSPTPHDCHVMWLLSLEARRRGGTACLAGYGHLCRCWLCLLPYSDGWRRCWRSRATSGGQNYERHKYSVRVLRQARWGQVALAMSHERFYKKKMMLHIDIVYEWQLFLAHCLLRTTNVKHKCKCQPWPCLLFLEM